MQSAMIVLVALMASGCTAALTKAELEAAANASGCVCMASKCDSVVSASGQAAISAEVQARRLQLERQR